MLFIKAVTLFSSKRKKEKFVAQQQDEVFHL